MRLLGTSANENGRIVITSGQHQQIRVALRRHGSTSWHQTQVIVLCVTGQEKQTKLGHGHVHDEDASRHKAAWTMQKRGCMVI